MTVKFRQYVGSPKFSIRFGGLTAQGGLTALQKSDSEMGVPSMHYCTPDGSEVSRRWEDPDGKLWDEPDLGKFYIDKDTKEKVIISPEVVAQTKEAKAETLPLNEMVLTVHPLDQCFGQVYPDGAKKSWVFAPKDDSPESKAVTAYLKAMAQRFAIMGHVNINHHEGLFRVVVWRGHLVLQPQAYTDTLRAHPWVDDDLDSDTVETLTTQFEALADDFEIDAYLDESKARVRAVLAAAAGDQDAQALVKATQEAKPVERDLLAVLDQAIAEKVNT